MKGIYEFYWDCGQIGSLNGIFVADSDDVKRVIGEHVNFGEVLGKHSEVTGMIVGSDIELKTDDQDFVRKFEEIMGKDFCSGYNPLDYYDPVDYEDEEEWLDED